MKKKISKAKHFKKLEKVFNQYIRRRDSKSGYGPCISCGEILPYERTHAGHYNHSKTSILRFNEMNVNAQCCGCNTYRSGNLISYREALVLKYSEEEVLEMESIRHQQLNMSHSDIDEQIEIYKDKLKTYEPTKPF